MNVTYADQFCDWLAEAGYTHCFFVSGGNIMHFLNSARSRFVCVPVVHEVAAGVAAEYFNQTADGPRAFALVTAGPGVTNIVTAIGGAWLESHELLVIAGQVKSTDLAMGGIRQRGIQEIDGVALVGSITKAALQIRKPLSQSTITAHCNVAREGRPGPVFIEFCLDAQGAPSDPSILDGMAKDVLPNSHIDEAAIAEIRNSLVASQRPIILLGGGLDRKDMREALPLLEKLAAPVMLTWNGIDRVSSTHPLYWGRPNTWGQRSANVLLQQSDLIIALGTRLGMQQTGFNWQGFAPLAKVIQVDIDKSELEKGHPNLHLGLQADALETLRALVESHVIPPSQWKDWKVFGAKVKTLLPTSDPANSHNPKFINPFDFVESLSQILGEDEIIVPCSSGGAYTTMMQSFQQKSGQKITNNKGLASMGYGLSGAIGAAYANPGKRTTLVEGDGGFAQNLQEVGTVVAGKLPIKMFIYDNGGYASMRMTQASYFKDGFVGYDRNSGLGLPDWSKFFASYNVPVITLQAGNVFSEPVIDALASGDPVAFIVPIDPEQTYFPKITSKVLANGSMQSNPLHLMTPELPSEVALQVFKYLKV